MWKCIKDGDETGESYGSFAQPLTTYDIPKGIPIDIIVHEQRVYIGTRNPGVLHVFLAGTEREME